MNQSVLSGFCQKCSHSITWTRFSNKEILERTCSGAKPIDGKIPKCIPVWFLSPKQIEIVYNSKEFQNYKWKFDNACSDAWILLGLLNEPFLVAKILKESEKK